MGIYESILWKGKKGNKKKPKKKKITIPEYIRQGGIQARLGWRIHRLSLVWSLGAMGAHWMPDKADNE
jgi:hypothetical protein